MGEELNQVARKLREVAREMGLRGLSMSVLQDGRVWVEADDAKGYTVWRLTADVEPGSSLPAPQAVVDGVLENFRRTRGGV